MGPNFFSFAMGPYPKESRIAAAKRNAVGGKRKRCTKGKNCSAACIAAHMVCLVDLPWVGPSLTKAVAQIQAMKGKGAPAAPAAKPVPAAKAPPAPKASKPAVKPAAKTPSKKPIDAIPSVEEYKKWGVPMLEAGIDSIKNSPKVKVNSPVPQKALGNMEEAIKQLKAEEAAKAKPAPATAAKPAAKPAKATPTAAAAPFKVHTVEKYKSYGLPLLEMGLQQTQAGPWADTPDGKKAIANVKQAIAELKAAPPKAAPGAQTVTPAAKPGPAATPAAKPPVFPSVEDLKKLGVYQLENFLQSTSAAPVANTPDGQKAISNLKQAIAELKAAPPKAAPAAQAATPAAKPATTPAKATPTPAATPAANPSAIPSIAQLNAAAPVAKPTPLVSTAAANAPQKSSPDNPHGLSTNQGIVWKKAVSPFSAEWFNEYRDTSSGGLSNYLKQQGKWDEVRIARLLDAAHNNLATKGLGRFFNQVKVNDKTSHMSESQLQKLPSSVRNLVEQFGQNKLKKMLLAVHGFTGSEYGPIRNAMRGRPPHKGDDKYMTPEAYKKTLEKYKRKGELIQEYLEASKNRPTVPKFRGVPMSDEKLKQMIDLSKTGGSFQEGAMNSWSTKADTALSFAKSLKEAQNRVIFRTINKSGSSVRSVSQIGHEDEILTPANSKYKVVGYGGAVKLGLDRTVHFFDVVEY